MNKLASMFLGSLLLAATTVAVAADKPPAAPAAAAKPAGKEVTLSGTLGCGKCSFKEAKACENVLKVKDGGKEVSYLLAKNAVSDENHDAVCHGTKPATVKGTVSEDKGRKVLTASQIKIQ